MALPSTFALIISQETISAGGSPPLLSMDIDGLWSAVQLVAFASIVPQLILLLVAFVRQRGKADETAGVVVPTDAPTKLFGIVVPTAEATADAPAKKDSR